MKSKQLILIAIALLCGLVSAIGIIQAMGNKGGVEVETPKGPVLVATTDLDIRAELTAESVHLENWPLDMIPEGAATDIESVAGKFTAARLRDGQAIFMEDCKTQNELNDKKIPRGHKVINIKVPAEDLLAGLLQPGDRVDIIGNFNTRRGGETKSETKTFLKGIRVFNIGDSTSVSDKNRAASASGIVGVLVTEKQSEKIVWARKNGEIRLALVGDMGDDELVEDPEFNMGEEPEVAETKPKSSGLQTFFNFGNSQPSIDKSKLRQVKVYSNGKVQTTFFDEDGNQVDPMDQQNNSMGMGMPGGMMPVGLPMPGGASGQPSVDYERFDGQADLPNGIEEDQYQGE
jgi:pilus assembly protein CpaB